MQTTVGGLYLNGQKNGGGKDGGMGKMPPFGRGRPRLYGQTDFGVFFISSRSFSGRSEENVVKIRQGKGKRCRIFSFFPKSGISIARLCNN